MRPRARSARWRRRVEPSEADRLLISGDVAKAENLYLGMPDLPERTAGLVRSGFIGYPTLRELMLEIDYRDDLVHVTYKPGSEATG